MNGGIEWDALGKNHRCLSQETRCFYFMPVRHNINSKPIARHSPNRRQLRYLKMQLYPTLCCAQCSSHCIGMCLPLFAATPVCISWLKLSICNLSNSHPATRSRPPPQVAFQGFPTCPTSALSPALPQHQGVTPYLELLSFSCVEATLCFAPHLPHPSLSALHR